MLSDTVRTEPRVWRSASSWPLSVACSKAGSVTARLETEPGAPCTQQLSAFLLSLLSRVQLFVTQWTGAHQAPLSMAFPRQEHWSGLPVLSPEDLPDSGNKPESPAWGLLWRQADSSPLSHQGSP